MPIVAILGIASAGLSVLSLGIIAVVNWAKERNKQKSQSNLLTEDKKDDTEKSEAVQTQSTLGAENRTPPKNQKVPSGQETRNKNQDNSQIQKPIEEVEGEKNPYAAKPAEIKNEAENNLSTTKGKGLTPIAL